jgi:hypothetical protein
MAVLSKKTIQRLAVLHALAKWRKGAYGPVRLHKTLFFADKETDETWRLFAFRKWYLGQYSDEISEALNALQDAGAVTARYDGPSERIRAEVRGKPVARLAAFFADYFSEWEESLARAFRKWAYLSNDRIIKNAHEDPSYKTSEHGELIFDSFDAECVEFAGLDDEEAEELSDLVDVRYQQGLLKRLRTLADRPARGEDWRRIYFGEAPRAGKPARSGNGHH